MVHSYCQEWGDQLGAARLAFLDPDYLSSFALFKQDSMVFLLGRREAKWKRTFSLCAKLDSFL